MSGKLLQQARLDAIKIATSGGFEEDILFKTKDGLNELVVKGLTTHHTMAFDNEGNATNAASVHITVAEVDFILALFPYQSQNMGRADFKNIIVTMPDNTGVLRNYVVNESRPNKTTGLIVCILGRAA